MKKLLILPIMLVALNAQAIVINETTNPALDTSFVDVGNGAFWDKDTGLEWLSFNYTFDMSMTMAQNSYGISNGGWSLAAYNDVNTLFDKFFPTITGTVQLLEGDGSNPLIQSRNSWLFDFGTDNPFVSTTLTNNTPNLSSRGLYEAADGTIQIMGVLFEPSNLFSVPEIYTTTLYGQNNTLGNGFDPGLTRYENVGVFLTRDYTPTVVPVPAAVWLFASGLLGLITIARRKA